MRTVNILVERRRTIQEASVSINRRERTLTFSIDNFTSKVYTVEDYYAGFAPLRADFPDIKFLCKGAKLNVHPSRMSLQMSSGMVAYEMHMGRPAGHDDIVRIFDYEHMDITNDIEQQKNYFTRWLRSIGHNLQP